ncbi:hypothetical protein BDA99DRAFT_92024 [Phascolomyces articulosus]|uniref:Galactose oxidase n=1 Tax=Phascolomyces articulosus TaxID=60185 RepID=A0AAD5JXI7_9FUNG|nr:hypothetical protein BDA99DRAFT_92024 [Phascolomyces articulosus]
MKLFSCLLLTLISIEISAITPQPRFGGDSTLLKRRLYYYGGGIDEIGNMNTSTSQELIYLDIEKSFEIKSGLSAWQKVNVTGDLQPEANYLYAMAVLPRSNSIAIYGGAGSNNGQLLQNTAVLYNETTGSWQTIDDPQSNLKQVYLASFQRGKGSIGYLFGGRSYAGDVYPPFAKEMQIFDPFTYSWTTGAAVPDEYGVRFRTPSALYHNDIYYIGGMSANYTNTQITHDNTMVPMSDILIYHIDENTWEKKTATGDVPAPRIMHTVTSKPNTNSIMVFGGKYNGMHFLNQPTKSVAAYPFLVSDKFMVFINIIATSQHYYSNEWWRRRLRIKHRLNGMGKKESYRCRSRTIIWTFSCFCRL